MKKLFHIIFLLTLSLAVSGQNDPKALSILDNFSSTVAAAPSVSMKFIMVTNDQLEKSSDTINGMFLLSGDRYKLELQKNIIWFDGRDSWSYLPNEKEVTITRPDKNDNSFESRPSSIFTIYKTGYKSRLVEEKKDLYLIDLYPEEIKNELIRVRLTIKKPSLDLLSFEYKRRDGITITLVVQDYSLKQQTDPGMFRFYPEKYGDVEIIDMR
jgi:outer membrane lipoprotein-sorting protein